MTTASPGLVAPEPTSSAVSALTLATTSSPTALPSMISAIPRLCRYRTPARHIDENPSAQSRHCAVRCRKLATGAIWSSGDPPARAVVGEVADRFAELAQALAHLLERRHLAR